MLTQVAEGIHLHVSEFCQSNAVIDLVGKVTGLPAGAVRIPWEGPEVRILEHSAHAPGHAALLIDGGVLVAGDMLSDVFMPMLDLNGTVDPLGDWVKDAHTRQLSGLAQRG